MRNTLHFTQKSEEIPGDVLALSGKTLGTKICSSCRTVLMLLCTEGPDWCIFNLGKSSQICKTAKNEIAKIEGLLYDTGP